MMVVAIFLGAFVDDKCYLLCMAKFKGRSVKLNKPFRTPSASKKFGVYVRNNKTNRVQIVRFGAKGMSIKKIYQLGKEVSLLDLDQYLQMLKGKRICPAFFGR